MTLRTSRISDVEIVAEVNIGRAAVEQTASQLIVKVKTLSRIRVIHHFRVQRPKLEKARVALPIGPRRVLAIGDSTEGGS